MIWYIKGYLYREVFYFLHKSIQRHKRKFIRRQNTGCVALFLK